MQELLLERALENLEQTYLGVGRQCPEAQIETWDCGVACYSGLRHAISNFAVIRCLEEWVAARLARLARDRPSFNLYVRPGAEQERTLATLGRSGFHEIGHLKLLFAEAAPPQTSSSLRPAATLAERLELSRFMARQFFPRQSSATRDAIALATARSEHELVGQWDDGLVGAAMVTRTNACFGIFNLCIQSERREHGYGSEMVLCLRKMAHDEGLLAVLQCESALEPWYVRRGFQSVDRIAVYGLARKPYLAIM